MAVKVSYRETGNVLIIDIGGRVDSFASDDLRAEFNDALRMKKRHVVLCMDALNYIDSRGIGALISFIKLIHNRGGTIRIAGIHQRVLQVFSLLSLEKMLPIHNSLDEALDAIP